MGMRKWSEFTTGSAFTGTEIVPGLDGGVNKKWTSAQLATYIIGLVSDGAPATLDTLNELAAALADDQNFSTTVANALAGKLTISSNLSDLADPSAARDNLGLGNAAERNVGTGAGTVAAGDDSRFGTLADAVSDLYELADGVMTVGTAYTPGSDATTLLQAVATAARDLGLPWRLRASVSYTVLGKVTTWTDLHCNGAQILTTNAGQDYLTPAIDVAPLDSDVESVTLTEANSWTLVKGSTYIPELAGQRGWTYTIDGGDVDIARDGANDIRQGQTFTVVTDDGQISTPLRVAFTQPFHASTVITRQRARRPIVIDGLNIRLTSSSGTTGRERLVSVRRDNTVLRNCSIFNETSLEILQGFVHERSEGIIYDNCSVDGQHVNATNYAWNGGLATDVTFRNCRASGGRRNIDAHRCADYRVIGGNYSDGIGGHWLHGLYLSSMPIIGASNPANPFCIHMSGSDIIGAARFMLDNGSRQAVKLRADIFELGGIVNLDGSDFRIDNSNNQIGASYSDVRLVRFGGQNASYDTGRPVSLPSSISIKGTVTLIGDCNFEVHALSVDVAATSTSFPQPIDLSGRGNIDLTLVGFPEEIGPACIDAGLVGAPPIRVTYVRNETSTGAGYDISIKGIPDLRLYAAAGTMDDVSQARASFHLQGVRRGVLTARYGAVKDLRLSDCAAPESIDITGGIHGRVGDEIIRFDDFGRPAASNIASGRYFLPTGHGTNTATFTVAADTLYLFAFDKTVDVDALAIDITTGAAGAARAGIYWAGPKGAPYLLMASAAELADTNSTGIKVMALPETLHLQGKCFIGVVFSGTPTIRASALSTAILHDTYGRGGLSSTTADAYLTAALTYGTLPVECPSVSAVATGSSLALAVRTA